ncbi:MAG: TonB-dependent receptor [Bacteroidota bacterium]
MGPLAAQPAETHRYQAIVQEADDGAPLAGVNVRVDGTTLGAATAADGTVALSGIPAGAQTLVFSFVGFKTIRRTLTFPRADPDQIDVVYLEEAEGDLEEIAVSATRTSRTIADQPTRVETIAGEEIDEKISMEPSNITMLLNESPGIMVQQTSAVSGGASIRIQGLDGRYTQLLKDGFPLFGGFSGGLSLLQVPPLDLLQVEIIKGPSSTLYGGDAIAGLVNLVSKEPTESPELSLLANATAAAGFDVGAFYTARGARAGLTLLASGNAQSAYDPDDDNFSNLPSSRRLTLSPRLFLYPGARTTVSVGMTTILEEREGGDVDALEAGLRGSRGVIEHNTSTRFTTQARLDHRLSGRLEGSQLTIKNSLSHFDRVIEVPGFRFDGQQLATYSEASLFIDTPEHDVVLGLDVRSDAFRERVNRTVALLGRRNYTYTSVGAFAQDTWDLSERLVLEAGLRADYHDPFGLFALPRLSALIRIAPNLSARVGGGLGYKAPTIFVEPSEERSFQDVLPLEDDVDAETSQGGGLDLNYQGLIGGRVALSLNQALYYTTLTNALVPESINQGTGIRYRNAEGTVRTRALETNAKFSLDDFKLFLGYVYLDTESATGEDIPLTPAHKTYTVLVYEQHGTGRVGLEAYYTGPQMLTNGARTDGYWVAGIMAERRFGPARLFLNFENVLDTKQSNYAPVVSGSRMTPQFAEIWAPMDGFIINGGLKYTVR